MTGTIYTRAVELMEAEIGRDMVGLDQESGACFGFNPVAACVWTELSTPKSFEQLRDALLADYDVAADQCSEELHALLQELTKQGLVREAS